MDHLYLALFGQALEAVGQLTQHLLLPAPQPVDIYPGGIKFDTGRGHFPALTDDLGGVQQRLGGDAAHVEADAAEGWITFNQYHPFAQIGSAEGRCIAARPRAQHDDLGLDLPVVAGGCRCPGLGCGCLIPLRLHLQHQDRITFRYLLPHGHFHRRDHARRGCGHVHGRLIAFEGD